MANTLELISSTTLGSAQSSIGFTSIPGTYTDLLLVISARVTRGTTFATLSMTFNGSTTGYSRTNLTGDGSSASSGSNTGLSAIASMEVPAANATTSTFGNHSIYIANYASSANKSVSIDAVSETNASTAYVNLVAGLWANSAAITSISFNEPNGGSNIAQYSTAYLYGVKNA